MRPGGQLGLGFRRRLGVPSPVMSTNPIDPRLADSLRSVAVGQLQTHASRSAALDAGALGVMAVDAAVAAIVIDTGGPDIWILALILLALSLSMTVWTLRLPGAEHTGPSVTKTLEARESQDDAQLEDWLLTDLADSVDKNEQTLARKAIIFDRALIFLVIAIMIELAGRGL